METLFITVSSTGLCYILNHMVEFQQAHLDGSFAALPDSTESGAARARGRFDELDKIVAELKLEKVDGRKMRR